MSDSNIHNKSCVTCVYMYGHLTTALLFSGVDLAALNLPEWDTYVLAGFVVFDVLIDILMEVLSWHYGHIGKLRIVL